MSHRFRFAVSCLGIAAIVAAFSVSVRAYTLSSYKWGISPVLFYLNPANADVSQTSAEVAIKTAMNAWNASGSRFKFYYAGRVSTTTTGNDAKNVILFRRTSNGGTIASTYSWTWNGKRVDSDIVFWDGGHTFYTGTSGCSSGAYIEDIAAHELGHSLGLGHSGVSGATMYSTYSRCSQYMRTLSSDDIAGIKRLYGVY